MLMPVPVNLSSGICSNQPTWKQYPFLAVWNVVWLMRYTSADLHFLGTVPSTPTQILLVRLQHGSADEVYKRWPAFSWNIAIYTNTNLTSYLSVSNMVRPMRYTYAASLGSGGHFEPAQPIGAGSILCILEADEELIYNQPIGAGSTLCISEADKESYLISPAVLAAPCAF